MQQPEITSYNNFLNHSILGLPQNDHAAEYILQEYFLPYNRLTSFIQQFRQRVQQYSINVLNVTARHVFKDTESLLSFSPHADMCALVVYIKLPKTQQARQIITEWTQHLIDDVIIHQGTYYLPYHLLATQKQFEIVYPQWSKFFDIKKMYDPYCVLSNQLYESYAQSATTSAS